VAHYIVICFIYLLQGFAIISLVFQNKKSANFSQLAFLFFNCYSANFCAYNSQTS